jgi:putative ABC transport system permease protein
VLGGMLHGVSPGDPATFTGVAVVVLGVGTVAAWLPARRAAALHPSTALRHE